MIVRIGFLRRRDDLDVESFRRHWLEVHGPLAARIPTLRRYEQQHIIDSPQIGVFPRRGPYALDGFAQLWFDDAASMQQGMAAEVSAASAQDSKLFIGEFKLALVEPTVFVPTPSGKPLIKRMSLLKRRPDVSAEQFRNEWQDIHAQLVKRLPQVKGYTQNLVVGRSVDGGARTAYADLPVDGIVELWFDDTASMNEMFTSRAGKTLMSHAEEFIDEITTFTVETHRIV